MKYVIIVCLLWLPVNGLADTNNFDKLLSQLSGVNAVEGSAVGVCATPGKFYTLSLEILKSGTQDDYHRMLTSTNAITRLMGFYCIVNTTTNGPAPCIPMSMLADQTRVRFASGGCNSRSCTVSDVAKIFIRYPDCLTPAIRKK